MTEQPFRSVISDEDGGNQANIAASRASHQIQLRASEIACRRTEEERADA